MRNRVLGICYPQEHDTLMGATRDYCEVIAAEGFATEVINAATPQGLSLLGERLAGDELAFCFGLQGVGSNIKKGDRNLWTEYKVPFLGLHFDNPCHNPFNHVNESPYVAGLYHYESFLETRRRYFDIPQLTGLLPIDMVHVPSQDNMVDFSKRPIRLLYLKSGGNLQACVDEIGNMPPPICDGVWAQLKKAEKNPNLLLADLVQEIFQTVGYDRRFYEKQFWGIVQVMDVYIRLKRSLDFVNWLKFQEGAVIVGDGWDMIDRTGTHAEFRPQMNPAEAYQLFFQTQFICNTNPYGRDIRHERVICGLLYGCCVVTDTNAWWDQHFSHVPALTRFYWDRPLSDQLQPVIGNPKEPAEIGRAAAIEHFLGKKSISLMVEYADRVRAFGESFRA